MSSPLYGEQVGVKKEALLVIRGSKSVMDWSINLDEAPTTMM